ncbi:MAG: bifunctional riboflavin kinase/FMN adenylyltransferase [Puniceicoccales bacterium]|nr:bifunctional riboflavin kinase/FMN adenylyltransferase [Puniceicoccales bacterium]
MKIHGSLLELPAPTTPAELAIGMFDGVHRGHQRIIGEAVGMARERGARAIVLTFSPHPSRVLTPGSPTLLLQSLEDRCARIAMLGVDTTIVLPFTAEFSRLPADAFVALLRKTLPGDLRVHVGENFRFGHGGTGNFLPDGAGRQPVPAASGAIPGRFETRAHPAVEDADGRVSSTRIRELLAGGETARANALLGWNYQSLARAVPGRALGRTIGFPTLNMPWTPELLPRFGVYAVRVRKAPGAGGGASLDAGGWFHGIANYGLRPTVETAPVLPLLEAHLFAGAGALGAAGIGEGARLLVEWLHFIRPERKFPGLPALLGQIRMDAESARRWLAPRMAR